MISDIPRLETDRLLLRAQVFSDWPDYRDFMMSGRSVFMGGPFSEKDAWGLFCNDLAQWGLFGHGALMIESRADGRCLGQVGLNAGPLFPEVELGWQIYPHAEGQGIAYEAAMRLRYWAYERLNLPTLVSYVDPPNLRSRALAERLGATLDAHAPKQALTDLVYRHPPREVILGYRAV